MSRYRMGKCAGYYIQLSAWRTVKSWRVGIQVAVRVHAPAFCDAT